MVSLTHFQFSNALISTLDEICFLLFIKFKLLFILEQCVLWFKSRGGEPDTFTKVIEPKWCSQLTAVVVFLLCVVTLIMPARWWIAREVGTLLRASNLTFYQNPERGPINCKTMRFILISRPQRVDKENNRNLEQNFLHLGFARKRSIFWCCIIQRKMSIVFTNCFQCEIKWCFIEEIVQVEICSCTLLIYKVVSQNFGNDLNKSYLCSGMKYNTNFLLYSNCVKCPETWNKIHLKIIQ